MPLINLMTSNNLKMDWCNNLYLKYGHNVTFNLVIVLLLLFAPYICNCVAGSLLSYKWLLKLLRLQLPPTTTWGPWIRDPQYEG